ncbi:protein-tyrosine phosphatase [Cognatiyoonia sediminum]|uniref:protein-tyrosine-phosphatase n=1 Tax=Cognatiyoonia sediminum TaxID=1508389 RepID=A0A1M5SHE6_9RHOB|nr:low molecular weight protein-tyrosine-phosphatase [Cognatiyoonia sediminum]SHH37919.1 protein-tyrosine phosphatase [Cognatiyoonia sediminum]
MRVLCVCLGNICRSPAAEAALRDRGVEVVSAGTGDWHVGKPPYQPMQDAGQALGRDLTSLRARQFNASDFQNFDLILAMDEDNAADIERLRPAGSTTPVRLFADRAVPDPYYTRDFEGAWAMIEKAADALIADRIVQPAE